MIKESSPPYLFLAVLWILSISSWRSNTHAAAASHSRDGESYLYNTKDAGPVLDHGLSGSDFTKSASPKVVEFYDPKCGACQAFKSNYVEVAKKVIAQKPNVEFYGVSCEAHRSICDRYGDRSVPKILAFPGASTEPQGGIEVPKGAGTIYFLSGRLMKALRTAEEIASDAEKLGSEEAPKRRLEDKFDDEDVEEVYEDGDEGPVSEEEERSVSEDGVSEDEDGVSEDEDGVSEDEDGEEIPVSGDEGVDIETGDTASEEDNGVSHESNDLPSDRRGKTEELSEDKDEEPKVSGERPSIENSNRSEGSHDRRQEVSTDEKHGRYEDAALLEKYVAGNRSGHRHKQVPRDNDERRHRKNNDERPGDKDDKLSAGSQDRHSVPEEQGQQPASPQDSDRKQAPVSEQLERYKHTDAYKNTMREFELKDFKRGKPKGYHFNKMKEERAAYLNKVKVESDARVRDARQIAEQKFPSSRQSTGKTARQREGRSKDGGIDNKIGAEHENREERVRDARDNVSQKTPSSRQPIRGDTRAKKTSDDNGSEVSKREEIETTTQKKPRPRKSIRGGVRQGGKDTGDKEREGKILDTSLETAAQQTPSSRVEGETRQKETASEDKTVLGRDHFPNPVVNGQQNSAPIPIVNINKPQDQGRAHQDPPLLRPHDHMKLGGDNFLNPFDGDPVKARKFEEYLARRKQMLERRQKLKHPVKTILGNGLMEEEDARAIHMKKSPMQNYKAQYSKQAETFRAPQPRPDLRPEAQQKPFGEKFLKKIPIVKRAFKKSKGEETLNDAALSFTRGLLMGVFKTNASLDYKRKAALVDWFDLLRVSLPPEIGLHELIDTLLYNIDSISQRQENLLEVLSKHPMPDNKWSNDCTKGMRSGGFFCGFWKLLHVMSVGFAEQAGGLALRESSPHIRVFSPKEAGDVVREYMAFFFNCDKCSKRFIAQYDDCTFLERCHRLRDETVGASAESWQEFPLWMWQVHNDISISRFDRASEFHKKGGRVAEAKQWELSLKAVYPHIDQCINCVTSAGTWKLNQVYRHLEKEYWTFGNEVVLDPKMEKFMKHTDIERGNVSHGLGAYVLVALLMLLTLFAKKHRIRSTGRHKKVETSSGPFSGKYRDS